MTEYDVTLDDVLAAARDAAESDRAYYSPADGDDWVGQLVGQ